MHSNLCNLFENNNNKNTKICPKLVAKTITTGMSMNYKEIRWLSYANINGNKITFNFHFFFFYYAFILIAISFILQHKCLYTAIIFNFELQILTNKSSASKTMEHAYFIKCCYVSYDVATSSEIQCSHYFGYV